MNKTDRPTFALETEYRIETAQNQIHTLYWSQLEQLQVSTPKDRRLWASLGPTPAVPESPNALRRVLAMYASSLFRSEVEFYPNDPQFLGHWLRKLAKRVTARVLKTVADIEESGTMRAVSLTHHGLAPSEMLKAINTGIEDQTKASLAAAVKDYLKTEMVDADVPGVIGATVPRRTGPERMQSTIECPAAARKLEAYLKSKGLGLTEFATMAGTTDRTLRKFRKTGKVRRSIFVGIATAMGTTKEALLKG